MNRKYIGIKEARPLLGDLVTAVQQGADIVLTRNGKPAARLVRYQEAPMPTVDTLKAAAHDLARQIDDEAAAMARRERYEVQKSETNRRWVSGQAVAEAMRRLSNELRTVDPTVRLSEDTERALHNEDLPVYADTDRTWFDRWRIYATPLGDRLRHAAWHWVEGYWQVRDGRDAGEYLATASAALAATDGEWAAR
ncbi:type II toxin-antitoxin system Phd/YefM family antitoxin [Actinoplanes siamensis]|uniref:Antitoxin n=1 Tax=Actinoplanes siamensis TaxID=1223317 RepID=A0A919NCF4_9ACTN|nr:type II toxin-antitoxin system prevent-host-death family antitoxin [Actinoplanes siamensis]GIF08644.1 hypothetical protein Asi03nite_61820 [Actinoplanes siamensis]